MMQTNSLEMTQWRLVGYRSADGLTVDSTGLALLQFHDGDFKGGTGMNSFQGNYFATSSSLNLSLILDGVTELGVVGEDAELLQAQEYMILSSLSQVKTYDIIDEHLRLFDKDNNRLLTYAAMPEAELRGSDWMLSSAIYRNESVVAFLPESGIVLKFSDEDDMNLILHT
ncbi:MAG: META domain-containing protein [Cyanobacteria bacterium P01_F01_bin.86]